MPEPTDLIVKLISSLGVTGLLIFLVVAFLREDLVPGGVYRRRILELNQENTRLLTERNAAFDELKQFMQLKEAVVNARKR